MNLFKLLSFALYLAWLQPCWPEGMPENLIKSAYVLNFSKFVEWPAGAIGTDGQLTLCVVGSDVLGGALLELDGRKAGDHPLHVVQHAGADDNLGSCHVVFIGESEQHQLASIIHALGNVPALTISDIENFAEKGGCIGLLHRENKIIFEINIASVQQAKLRLPAQLLNLAAFVYGR